MCASNPKDVPNTPFPPEVYIFFLVSPYERYIIVCIYDCIDFGVGDVWNNPRAYPLPVCTVLPFCLKTQKCFAGRKTR